MLWPVCCCVGHRPVRRCWVVDAVDVVDVLYRREAELCGGGLDLMMCGVVVVDFLMIDVVVSVD